MKTRLTFLHSRATLCGLALLAVAVLASLTSAGGNKNPRVLPPHANAFGMSYGDWSEEWWKWIISIPVAENPGLDATGEFAHVGQEGNVWFLAGLFGTGEVERSITVPTGKALFFPLINWVWWAPEDLGTAVMVAESLGFTPEEIAAMTDEELMRLLAAHTAGEPELTLTIDGQPVENLLDYYAESDAFQIVDTDFIDDAGLTISQPNTSVAAGYWIMLAPLPPGEHTIRWTADSDVPGFETDLDITYHITVVPGRR